jgi:hypothetical protein
MHIKVMLQTSHIGDMETPIRASDQDDDDEDGDPSPYSAAALTDAEAEAVRALLGQALPAPRGAVVRGQAYEAIGTRTAMPPQGSSVRYSSWATLGWPVKPFWDRRRSDARCGWRCWLRKNGSCSDRR